MLGLRSLPSRSSKGRHSTCRAARSTQRRGRFAAARSHRLPIVATSEFWWEDEQEFDALTEILLPKQVYLTTPSAAVQQLEQLKASTKFAAAFTAPSIKDEAEQLWQQLGRAGPPLFLKVRVRNSLQECEQDSSNANAAAEQFWQELTGQSWRTELDYGLACAKNATSAAEAEQILVVLGTDSSMDCLIQAAVGDGSRGSVKCGVVVVGFEGWNQGQTQQQLVSWREQLQPRLQQLMAV